MRAEYVEALSITQIQHISVTPAQPARGGRVEHRWRGYGTGNTIKRRIKRNTFTLIALMGSTWLLVRVNSESTSFTVAPASELSDIWSTMLTWKAILFRKIIHAIT